MTVDDYDIETLPWIWEPPRPYEVEGETGVYEARYTTRIVAKDKTRPGHGVSVGVEITHSDIERNSPHISELLANKIAAARRSLEDKIASL